MREYIKLVCIAIGGSIAVKFNAFLLSKNLDALYSLVISGLFAVIMYKILEYILTELPLHNKKLRRVVEPKSKFEGEWIFELKNLKDRPYSLVSVGYIPEDKVYHLSGYGVGSDGNIKSKWNSTELLFNTKKNEIVYCYESRIIDDEADVTSGYGVMKLEQDHKGKLTRGAGFFADTGSKFFKCNYLIEKVTQQTLQACLDKKDLCSNRDVEELIKKYHSSRKSVELGSNLSK